MVESSQYSLLNVFAPLIGLAVNVLMQILSFRCQRNPALLKSIVFGFAIGMIVVITMQGKMYNLLSATSFPQLVTNVTIYSALAYCYFHFLNLGETARRIRIVRELYDFPNGLSMEEILGLYNSRDMVKLRINRLVSNGQILHRDGNYYIGKPVMLWMARIILLLKRILLGQEWNV